MSENRIWIAAAPEDVWAVLADPRLYASWVVGTAETHGIAGSWPERGARLRYSLPGGAADETRVLASEPPRLLELHAALGPAGALAIRIALERSGDGTQVTLREDVRGPAAVAAAVADAANVVRYAVSLERLKELAEA